MKSLLKAIILIPLVVAAVGFSVANRNAVSVSLDLFELGVFPWRTTPVPLYAALLAAMALGVALGGMMVWLSQGRHRRAARLERRCAGELRREVESLRAAPSSTAVALR